MRHVVLVDGPITSMPVAYKHGLQQERIRKPAISLSGVPRHL